MSLGEKIFLMREKRGLSQDGLAETLNVSRQTISNWENDKVKIDVEKAKELCRIFNIGVDELLSDDEYSPQGQIENESKTANKKVTLALTVSALVFSVVLIIISAVLLAQNEPDGTSSTISLSVAAGWVIIAICGLIVLGITAYLLVKNFKKK